MQIYERNINTQVRQIDKARISVLATFLDLDHCIRAEIEVNTKTRQILSASAEMAKVPYKLCHNAAIQMPELKGLEIGRGVIKEITTRIGHRDGCSHLVELTSNAVRVVATVLLWRGIDVGDEEAFYRLPEEERIRMTMPLLKDSCLPYKSN